MKRITILINGHPNSGKTSLKDRLIKYLSKYGFFTYDYDENFKKAANSIQAKTREDFRKAKDMNISGIIESSKKANVIADLLMTTDEVGSLKYKIKNNDTEVIVVRLFCDFNIRTKRDINRQKNNPDAPHGFNDSLNPSSNPIVYDLELDTSIKNLKQICNEVISHLNTKGLI